MPAALSREEWSAISHRSQPFNNPFSLESMMKAVASLPLTSSTVTVLDVGCGKGGVSILIAKAAVAAQVNLRIEAIDTDAIVLNEGRAAADAAGVGRMLEFHQSSYADYVGKFDKDCGEGHTAKWDIVVAIGATHALAAGTAASALEELRRRSVSTVLFADCAWRVAPNPASEGDQTFLRELGMTASDMLSADEVVNAAIGDSTSSPPLFLRYRAEATKKEWAEFEDGALASFKAWAGEDENMARPGVTERLTMHENWNQLAHKHAIRLWTMLLVIVTGEERSRREGPT